MAFSPASNDNNYSAQTAAIQNQNSYLILKFSNCTPSVTIGTVYVTMSVSVFPIS